MAARRADLGIEPEQRGIVVEHFFEVRNAPVGIGRVAIETATEVIEQATGGHRAQADFDQRRMINQQQLKRLWMGELRRAAEAAVLSIEALGQMQDRARHERGFETALLIRACGQRGLEPAQHAVLELGHLCAMFAIGARHSCQHIGETRPPVTRGVREIGAAEIRHLILRGEEHGQRPAAVGLREQLVGGLIDLVEVGAFFAIDLDVDEQAVHERGDGRIGEGLVGHHMAPMAGRIADRQ